jgi:photosystem II stability/assembly factor-like uncharacterized protein
MAFKEDILKICGNISVLFFSNLKVNECKSKLMHLLYISFAVITLTSTHLKAQTITLLHKSISSSIRGLSVVDDSVAWVSGSKGTVGITVDGGKTWSWPQVRGFEKIDFRDIEAFSDKEAIIISSGTPAVILKTIDGGVNWLVTYQNNDKAYFLDAMEFDGRNNGIILGDPINGKFLILETFNGGKGWTPAKNSPAALPNEAAFAASGTCLRKCKRAFIMVTGGSNARMITLAKRLNNRSHSWNIPILHGKASQGAFSIAFGRKQGIIVGGDYSNASRTDSVSVYMHNTSMRLSVQRPAGYQSCVENIKENYYLSTGTPGSNLTNDGGKTWRKIDAVSYNVCKKAKHGNLILLAGDDGKIGIYKP